MLSFQHLLLSSIIGNILLHTVAEIRLVFITHLIFYEGCPKCNVNSIMHTKFALHIELTSYISITFEKQSPNKNRRNSLSVI